MPLQVLRASGLRSLVHAQNLEFGSGYHYRFCAGEAGGEAGCAQNLRFVRECHFWFCAQEGSGTSSTRKICGSARAITSGSARVRLLKRPAARKTCGSFPSTTSGSARKKAPEPRPRAESAVRFGLSLQVLRARGLRSLVHAQNLEFGSGYHYRFCAGEAGGGVVHANNLRFDPESHFRFCAHGASGTWLTRRICSWAWTTGSRFARKRDAVRCPRVKSAVRLGPSLQVLRG
ncbi:hypothetical protein STH2183 [Symbiobacterium thermophilum IAM 14863]|uniref:Uncharacterized protein n=1 Tax=Symbiobacterium thermophilum (strain DSM 24528 / JCM 14929 / IAM 14863 / T) TaxID=292459 RepID=Q67MC5_SYMTH|nr:hypothetical protein STH2183 [Symbiobacterium thermophilum IAM 14863]